MARAAPIGSMASTVRVFADRAAPQALIDRLRSEVMKAEREGRAANQRALSYDSPPKRTIDGREGAGLGAITTTSRIVVEFEVLGAVIDYAIETLHRLSPVYEGDYLAAHEVLVNDNPIVEGQRLNPRDVITIINRSPYARNIEFGSSSKAPAGVYRMAASIVRRKFRNLVTVKASKRWAEEPSLEIRQKTTRSAINA